MVLSLGFVMGFIGIAIALLIGLMIFSSVTNVLDEKIKEEIVNPEIKEAYDQKTNTFWIVISILPIALFFVLFTILGGGFEFNVKQNIFTRIFWKIMLTFGLASYKEKLK